MNTNIGLQLENTFSDAINRMVSFFPEFLAGLLILLVGWIIASLLRTAVKKGLHAINAEKWLGEAGISDRKQQDTWIHLFSQIVFWTVLIFFLIPTLEAWELLGATNIISELVGYLPNVIAAVIIGFLGYILARLAHQLVEKSTQGFEGGVSVILPNVARYAILGFTSLIVLRQLQIAPDLISILFGAIMLALALAIGLAFGLGGRETASRILNDMMERGRRRQ